MTQDGTWAILRYERTLLRQDDGLKLYVGHFCRGEYLSRDGWEECTVMFWARRPVLAMRAIVQSGKNPAEFAGQEVN